ncbi:hypothetical protein JL475_31745 [Streptomyces sp. M2CJ-2]|uniref:hypothetical protein n=1 Tax=Streptomyces sp. M2CJ-2 TaxID=2803948 RepID=UPI001928E018|nr:hypothetical protein [Streptomyces sp. M2CJ-2]MBL3670471.1 hypothetical protein [Streptomyces sp. M2CJ-2]
MAGLGAWLYIDFRKDQAPCRKLLQHERIPTALGAAHKSNMSCAELGAAIERATNGAEPGQHSLKQAQAMKGVLVAIDDVIEEEHAPLDRQLTGPISTALTSYAKDLYKILIPGDIEYSRRTLPWDKAWTDSEGAHMSFSHESLVRIMMSLSSDPEAYATLRESIAQQAAQDLANAPSKKLKSGLSGFPAIAGRALGIMDAVAIAAREDTEKEKRNEWEEKVFTRLSSNRAGRVPSFEDDPDGHIIAAWKKTLPSAPPDDLLEVLETQSPELVRVWTTALGTSNTEQSSLIHEARGTAWSAQNYTLRHRRN